MKMEKKAYRGMYEREDSHWWFLGRRKVLGALLDGLELREGLRILDVGCGTGGNFPFLAGYGEVEGCDYSEEAIRFCRLRGGTPVQEASIYELPYEDGSFDLVTCLDVIEHLRFDLPAFRELARVLKPGGHLLATLPARPRLYSDFDCVAGHLRRYTLQQIRMLLREGGFETLRLTGYTAVIHPVVRFYKWKGSITDGRGDHSQGMDTIYPSTDRLLRFMLGLEARIISRWDLPGASSVAALARKEPV
jgi:SAM-dependent methyltransferase